MSGGFFELGLEFWVGEDFFDFCGEVFWAESFGVEAAVAADFTQNWDVAGEDGDAAGGGFDDRHAEAFVEGGHDEEVGVLVEGDGLLAGDVVDVEDVFALRDCLVEEVFCFLVFPGVAADEDEAVLGFEVFGEELVGTDEGGEVFPGFEIADEENEFFERDLVFLVDFRGGFLGVDRVGGDVGDENFVWVGLVFFGDGGFTGFGDSEDEIGFFDGTGNDAVEVGEVFSFDDFREIDVAEVVDGDGAVAGFD